MFDNDFLFSCIGEICKKSEDVVKDVLKTCGVPFFLDILNSHHEETVTASSYVIQVSLLELWKNLSLTKDHDLPFLPGI